MNVVNIPQLNLFSTVLLLTQVTPHSCHLSQLNWLQFPPWENSKVGKFEGGKILRWLTLGFKGTVT